MKIKLCIPIAFPQSSSKIYLFPMFGYYNPCDPDAPIEIVSLRDHCRCGGTWRVIPLSLDERIFHRIGRHWGGEGASRHSQTACKTPKQEQQSNPRSSATPQLKGFSLPARKR